MTLIQDSNRIINGMTHKVLTVDGYDRCQINERLQDLITQRDKIQDKIDNFHVDARYDGSRGRNEGRRVERTW